MCDKKDQMGRLSQVLCGATSTHVVKAAENRVGLVLTVESGAQVFIVDNQVATVTNGVPLNGGNGPLEIWGKLASHPFNAITAGGNVKVGVIEYVKPPE